MKPAAPPSVPAASDAQGTDPALEALACSAGGRSDVRLPRNRVDRKKLLRSKWTAVSPIDKEKHFMVVRLVDPERAGDAVEKVELEAVISGRTFLLRWRELGDTARWKQGWVQG